MNIVQINATFKNGSTGRLAYELSEAITASGNTSKYVYSVGESVNPNDYHVGNKVDKNIHALLSRITGKQGYFSYFSTKKLIKNLHKFNPDIIHLHNLHANYINLKLLFDYIIKYDIAVVITLHDCWLYTGKCTHYINANCEKWKDQCKKCPLLHIDNNNPTYLFDKSKTCFNDKREWLNAIKKLATVGVSKWISHEASQSIMKTSEISTVYNWVDQNNFYPRETQNIINKYNIQNKFIILMVSNWISPIKGYKEMMMLSKILSDEYQFIIVGENEDDLEIPNNVIHIKHTHDVNQLAELYSTADVCLNTTKYETFGMVTVEAMSCGTPVIVYNNTASPELLGEGCGYVINESDGIDSIMHAIKEIKLNGKKYYSSNCLKRSNSKFNKDKNIANYLDLYNRLCL